MMQTRTFLQWISVLGLVLLASTAWAQQKVLPASLVDEVSSAVDQDAPRLDEIFKDLHQNPELGFMEKRTAGIVAGQLEELGYEVMTGIGVTGVVGVLRNGEGPTVMYRADMDANAVEEATGLPYASTARVIRDNEDVPVAHLCGHDANVTWMLGMARVMVQLRDQWKGTLILVAQPAEEPILGAKAMVADGLYQRLKEAKIPPPDYLVGLHTAPIPTGTLMTRPGDINAGTDQLDVTFHGIGGHGSMPHLTKDPVVMAALAIVQYQFIISRGIDPLHAPVITVGSVTAGADNNVIPASSLLKINLRWYDEEDRTIMVNGIDRINKSIAAAYNLPPGLEPTLVMKGGSSVLSNDAGMLDTVAPVLSAFLGEDAVMLNGPKLMGSEDFHHLVVDTEGVSHRYLYMYVGTADPADVKAARARGMLYPYSNHNPDYKVDLNAIPIGAKIASLSALTFFAEGSK